MTDTKKPHASGLSRATSAALWIFGVGLTVGLAACVFTEPPVEIVNVVWFASLLSVVAGFALPGLLLAALAVAKQHGKLPELRAASVGDRIKSKPWSLPWAAANILLLAANGWFVLAALYVVGYAWVRLCKAGIRQALEEAPDAGAVPNG